MQFLMMDREQKNALLAMGFEHIVVQDHDFSITMKGSVISAFSHSMDAAAEAERLTYMYTELYREPCPYVVINLKEL